MARPCEGRSIAPPASRRWHMVHAWAVDQRLLLGQTATDAKSNEITAVPKLLAMRSLKGCIVTADAMNCQRAICAQVVEQGGDYVIALKGNQGTLHDDVRRFLDDPDRPGEATHTTVDADHGRIETRTGTVCTDIGWAQDAACVARSARDREDRPHARNAGQDRDRYVVLFAKHTALGAAVH